MRPFLSLPLALPDCRAVLAAPARCKGTMRALQRRARMNHDPQTMIANARRDIRDYLGADRVKALHRQNRGLDALAFCAVIVLWVLASTVLVTRPVDAVWLICLVLQGFVFQLAGLVSHDLFVHRRVGGERWAAWGARLLTLPRLSLPMGYESAHLAHHRHLGSSRDTENYKQHLDSRRKRLLFSTLLGIKLVQSGRGDTVHYHHVDASQPARARALRLERWLLRGFLLTMLVLTGIFPLAMASAYWLPLLVVAPLVNTVRIVLEHADADINSGDAFQAGTFYRTGLLTRVLFLWDSGDCHLVHHIFPRMPWYHVGACVDELRPLMAARNPRPRRHLLGLLKGWYLDNHGHRQPWPSRRFQSRAGAPRTS